MLTFLRVVAKLVPTWVVCWLINRYFDRLLAYAVKHPYYHLPGYMNRYWLFKDFKLFGTRWSGRIHETMRSDADRHLHDHPYDNVSVILMGAYIEVMPLGERTPGYTGSCTARVRVRGDVVVRAAQDPHRLIVPDDGSVYSLFLTRVDRKRRWGFWTEDGWVYWRRYVDPATLSPEELKELLGPPETDLGAGRGYAGQGMVRRGEVRSSGELRGIHYEKRHGKPATRTYEPPPTRSVLREKAYEEAARQSATSKRGTSGEEG